MKTNTSVTEKQQDELLTIPEVAKRLRVHPVTVRVWIRTGSLGAITLPHKGKRRIYRIKASDMRTFA